MTPAIEVHDLTVAYREKPVLWDIDLGVPAPERNGGPSVTERLAEAYAARSQTSPPEAHVS